MPPKNLSGSESKASWANIISQADTTTKLLALFALVAEATFLASLAKLQGDQVLKALYVCAAFLLLSIFGILGAEMRKNKADATPGLRVFKSPFTPNTPPLSELVNTAIESICRAVSLPQNPEDARLRVFIFRKEGNSLVCSHHWAQNPVQEMVGKLRFEINLETAQEVAVVRAVMDEKICRTPVKPLPNNLPGHTGKVSKDLSYVLATPIYTKKGGDIWGTVDFDAGNEIGEEILKNPSVDATMYQLAEQLTIMLSVLPTWGHAEGAATQTGSS